MINRLCQKRSLGIASGRVAGAGQWRSVHQSSYICPESRIISHLHYYPARARSARARRACALRALGLLLADGTSTGGRGEDFLSRQPSFFTETAVTPERKVEKPFPMWEINKALNQIFFIIR